MSQNCCWHYLVQLTGNLWTLQMACFWVSGNPQNNVACVRPPLSLDFYCEKTNSNCWHCLVQLTGNLWTLQMAILVPVVLWGIAQIFCGLYILSWTWSHSSCRLEPSTFWSMFRLLWLEPGWSSEDGSRGRFLSILSHRHWPACPDQISDNVQERKTIWRDERTYNRNTSDRSDWLWQQL